MKTLPRLAIYFGVALAYVMGSASLLLLLAYLYLGSFHFFRFNLDLSAALIWDAILCLAFFLQHSGMVRRSFRQRLERIVPEQFYGLVYTAASSSVLILCMILWQATGITILQLEGAFAWPLRAIFLLSMAGFFWGARTLSSFDTFGIKPALAYLRGTQVRDILFVMKGPYRWVRHPFYFFAIVLFWSCPVITLDRLLFNIFWTIWVVLGTLLEERDLVSHFGEPYVRFQRQVPMILPWRIPKF